MIIFAFAGILYSCDVVLVMLDKRNLPFILDSNYTSVTQLNIKI